MARPRGPLDRGEHIGTLELLSAIDDHGPHWPAALSGYTLEAVSTAVGREIMAGNLADGRTITGQGAKVLADLRQALTRPSASDEDHPDEDVVGGQSGVLEDEVPGPARGEVGVGDLRDPDARDGHQPVAVVPAL